MNIYIFPGREYLDHIIWGKEKHNIICAGGHSVFKRDSKTNIGILLKKHGGGGLCGAGTCQLDPETADQQIAEIIEPVKKDG